MFHHPDNQPIEISLPEQVPVHSETELIKVALQMVIADMMVDSSDPTFQLLNEPMNGLEVFCGATL